MSEGHFVNRVSGDLKETSVISPLQVFEESVLLSRVVNNSDFQPFAPHGTRKLFTSILGHIKIYIYIFCRFDKKKRYNFDVYY